MLYNFTVGCFASLSGHHTGRKKAAYMRREQRYLAGVSPFVGWRAWPATGGG